VKSQYVLDVIEGIHVPERDFILVDHNSSINGASHSLFILANYLKSQDKSFVVLTPNSVDNNVCEKYELDSQCFVLYHNDPTILFWLCEKIQSAKIIMNSINRVMAHVMQWIRRDRLILFSREIKQHYMRSSCYEPDVVITNLISNAYETLPLVQTPICPIFLQNKICSNYEEEVYIENFNEKIITIGMCGNLAERKNFRIFLKVAEHLPQYNFMWIGGDKLDTNLPNVFHISNTTNPFKYYKCIDYFVLFSECEPFGNVVIENLLLNKKILAFKDNVWFDFKHELTKENYFEYDGNITTENAIKHILTNATQKQELKEYKDTPSNLYVKSNFSHYTSDFLKLLKQKKNYRNNIKQITNKQDVFVKCKSGFCNQLRLMLAGSFLVTNGFINSYTQEWLLSNENNVDYLGYFNSLPGVTLAPITEGKSVSFNNVIHTT
jgi:hypothetical protein